MRVEDDTGGGAIVGLKSVGDSDLFQHLHRGCDDGRDQIRARSYGPVIAGL